MNRPTINTRIIHPLSFKFILIITLLEIFLGGGGRLMDVGTVSPRMYLFAIGIIVSTYLIFRLVPVGKPVIFILFCATIMMMLSSFIGVYNEANVLLVFNDIKPLLSFYSLLFFYYTIKDINDVFLVTRLLKISALILAILYIIAFILINGRLISFDNFYRSLSSTEEFFFRGEFAFFYKGFLYMCIGLLFYLAEDKRKSLVIVILATAIILTFTRGFFISIVITYLFYHVAIRRSASKFLLFLILAIVAILSLWNVFYTSKIDRKTSDSARLTQIREVLNEITPASVFVGHGFGIGVPSRPDRMEITYLETFHKQGIIGLLFWTGLFFLNWRLYVRAVRNGSARLAGPFILSIVFVYAESLTNPYLTNPIGLTMVLLSLVCLTILGSAKSSVAVKEIQPGAA